MSTVDPTVGAVAAPTVAPAAPAGPGAVLPDVPVFDDPRGRLVPVEFDGLPFVPQRVFAVVAPEEGATRGDHVVPCRELVVLVTGSARVVLADDGGTTERHLTQPGDTCLLEPGAEVVYHLSGGATVVVLADRPYAS